MESKPNLRMGDEVSASGFIIIEFPLEPEANLFAFLGLRFLCWKTELWMPPILNFLVPLEIFDFSPGNFQDRAYLFLGFPSGSDSKEFACNAEDPGSIPGLRRSPGEGNWLPTPVFLPGKFHGQRSLVIYSPQGRKELNMNEHTLTADKNLLTGSATHSHNQEAS